MGEGRSTATAVATSEEGSLQRKGILASCCAFFHQLLVTATYLQQPMSTGTGKSVGRSAKFWCKFFSLLKPFGERKMTTEASGGYCWKPLAMNLHVSGLDVMVALMSTWRDDSLCILP